MNSDDSVDQPAPGAYEYSNNESTSFYLSKRSFPAEIEHYLTANGLGTIKSIDRFKSIKEISFYWLGYMFYALINGNFSIVLFRVYWNESLDRYDIDMLGFTYDTTGFQAILDCLKIGQIQEYFLCAFVYAIIDEKSQDYRAEQDRLVMAQNVASEVSQNVAPEVGQDVAPEVAQDVVPEVAQDVVPVVSQNVAPEVSQDMEDTCVSAILIAIVSIAFYMVLNFA